MWKIVNDKFIYFIDYLFSNYVIKITKYMNKFAMSLIQKEGESSLFL